MASRGSFFCIHRNWPLEIKAKSQKNRQSFLIEDEKNWDGCPGFDLLLDNFWQCITEQKCWKSSETHDTLFLHRSYGWWQKCSTCACICLSISLLCTKESSAWCTKPPLQFSFISKSHRWKQMECLWEKNGFVSDCSMKYQSFPVKCDTRQKGGMKKKWKKENGCNPESNSNARHQ